MTDILAIDLASTTGFARGDHTADAPVFGTVRFFGKEQGKQERDQDAIFTAALQWIMETVREQPPDLLILESMLPPGAMQNHTSRAVRDRLAGLHGIIRAASKRLGVGEISETSVGDVRAHFIGERGLQRREAKSAVMERCRLLGWMVNNDNEGDACAIWSYAVSLIDPQQALRVSPLFNKKLRMVVQ